MANEPPEQQDPEIGLLEGLRGETRDAYASFKKKLASGTFTTPEQVASEMDNLFSLLVDVSEKALSLHADLVDWRAGVDEELDAMAAGEAGSALTPTDALNIKTFILALQQNLRASTGPEDNAPQVLSDKVADTLKFIDDITVDPDDEEEGDDEDDEDEDQN